MMVFRPGDKDHCDGRCARRADDGAWRGDAEWPALCLVVFRGYAISYRDLEEIIGDRGVVVDQW